LLEALGWSEGPLPGFWLGLAAVAGVLARLVTAGEAHAPGRPSSSTRQAGGCASQSRIGACRCPRRRLARRLVAATSSTQRLRRAGLLGRRRRGNRGDALGGLRPGSRVSFAASCASIGALVLGLAIDILPRGMRKPSAQDARWPQSPGKPGGEWLSRLTGEPLVAKQSHHAPTRVNIAIPNGIVTSARTGRRRQPSRWPRTRSRRK